MTYQPNAAQVLRKPEVCRLLGISAATLDRMRARGEFVRPIKISEQAIGWPLTAVHAWIESRPVAHHFVESLAF